MARHVPTFKQNFGFSCGPASLLMAMHGIDRSMKLDKLTEVDIWREATLHETPATSGHGLAVAAMNRGFRARVWYSEERLGFEDRIKLHFPEADLEFMYTMYEITKEKARSMGVEEHRREVTIDDIRSELGEGHFPVPLVSTALMGEDPPIPHWVLVLHMDDAEVEINNPETGEREKYGLSELERNLHYRNYFSMVSIWR
jgi:hypothetical protein